jgi:FtsP/CotA-like multicopper oxidase with cupredoxin domain
MIWHKNIFKTFLVMVVITGVLLSWNTAGFAVQSQQTPIAGSAIPQFKQALPLLHIGGPVGTGIYTTTGNVPLTLTMCEFWANVLPPGTFAVGVQPKTRVWGYIVGSTCPPNGQNDPALDTYIGPVIANDRGSSTDVTFFNNLGNAATTQVLFWKYSTDQTLHWADPQGINGQPGESNYCAQQPTFPGYLTPCAQNYDGPIPAVPHLHGGEVPPELDGGPDAWFTSDGAIRGHGYYTFPAPPDPGVLVNSALYKYPNTQEAAPIWFHDHVLGTTRLNVHAGLAGAYFIEDPAIYPTNVTTTRGTAGTCAANCLPDNLQPLSQVIPLVLQDRMFDNNGQLFFPADSAGNVLWSLNPEHPYWVPEFVGDTIVVNGKAWPFLNVEARRYRFLILNGSNARTYELSIPGGPTMYVISTDGGYLDTPVAVNKLVIMPGERYGVIMDFVGLAGKKLILKNTARTPYPKGAPPHGSTLGNIVQFIVGAAPAVADASYNPALGTPLRTGSNAIVRLTTGGALPATVNKTRQLTLNEVLGLPKTVTDPVTGVLTAYPGGPLEILVNNTKWSGKLPDGTTRNDFTAVTTNGGTTGLQTSYYSELPQEGTTEVWEIVNLTADAHPIHLHLVQFQIINRQNFNVSNYNSKAYFPAFTGSPAPLPLGCTAGVYCPGYGPPLTYGPTAASGNKYGGNPDVMTYLQGGINLPLPQEQGWKDTVVALPGMVTRLAVRWSPTDIPVGGTGGDPTTLYYPFNPDGVVSGQPGHGYVWHCHIIDHEDNEMMRPDIVTLPSNCLNPTSPCYPANRPLVKGVAY